MLYTPKQATQLTGASLSSLRNYTANYARYFSSEATETPRKFTEDDLRLIACVLSLTKEQGLKHSEVAERLASELETFEWTPQDATEAPQSADSGISGDIVPVATLNAVQALLFDSQARERQAIDEKAEALARVAELERKLGQAEGKIDGYRERQYRAPAWWRALFGGENRE